MLKRPASNRSLLSSIERDEAVDLYETGALSGAQLARRYGVHRDVIYRHLIAAGAVKGRRVHETIRDLESEITARQRARLRAKWKADNRRLDQFIETAEAVEEMMKALLRADQEGRLGEFGKLLPTT